jgi:hypothetical protein
LRWLVGGGDEGVREWDGVEDGEAVSRVQWHKGEVDGAGGGWIRPIPHHHLLLLLPPVLLPTILTVLPVVVVVLGGAWGCLSAWLLGDAVELLLAQCDGAERGWGAPIPGVRTGRATLMSPALPTHPRPLPTLTNTPRTSGQSVACPSHFPRRICIRIG